MSAFHGHEFVKYSNEYIDLCVLFDHEDAVYMVCVQKIALLALKRNLLFHIMRNVPFTMTSQKKLIICRKLRHVN